MANRLDFKAIAEAVDVEAVAQQHGLKLVGTATDRRTRCPVCATDDDRSLAVYPETNSFRCYAIKQSGDSIALHAHLNGSGMYAAAKSLAELFLPEHKSPQGTAPPTPPQKPQKVEPTTSAFDPASYAEKLAYTDQIAALGISEKEAKDLGIGWSAKGFHTGIAFALRWPSGEIAGFVSCEGMKFPRKLVPPTVVPLRRPA